MRRRCCCRGDRSCVITVVWLRDAANAICRVVVGATVTAYDSGGGVIDAQTTDDNGQVGFSAETCATAYVIIATKAGYTACGTGVDRIGHGSWGLTTVVYLFPESLGITCGGTAGTALVNVDVTSSPGDILVSWIYSVLMGPGGDCCVVGDFGLTCECGHGSSGVSLQFLASMTGGAAPTLRVTEGAPVSLLGVFQGCYIECQLLDTAGSGDCHQILLDATSWQTCLIPVPYASRACTPTLACPTGDPVATCTIPANYPGGIPGIVSGTMSVAAP